MKAFEEKLKDKCFRNQQGVCHFLESAQSPCTGVCANFICFDDDVKHEINKKVMERHHDKSLIAKENDPLTWWQAYLAFGERASDNGGAQTQGALDMKEEVKEEEGVEEAKMKSMTKQSTLEMAA